MNAAQSSSKLTPGPELVTIGTLSRETGIPVPTLRTWERRYGEPAPLRRPSGHRLYPAASVARLKQVASLIRQGHRAASLLALAEPLLQSLAERSAERATAAAPEPRWVPGESPERALAALMRATRRLDRGSILGELRLAWARLGPLRFLSEIAGPFMTEVGEGWRTQEIEVRHEHFAAACLGGLLQELRQPYDHTAAGPRVVTATLPAEQHEGGLLMAALVLALRGRRVIHLGADTPLSESARAAELPRVEAIAVSVSAAHDRDVARARLLELREQMPAGVALWVGGAGAPAGVAGVERFADLDAFDRRLVTGA